MNQNNIKKRNNENEKLKQILLTTYDKKLKHIDKIDKQSQFQIHF